MPKIYEGNLIGSGLTFAIVVSRFNSFITDRLLEGALDTLKRHGVDLDDVSVFRTPGSYEIPSTAKRLADTGKFNAIICLGAVIRGATPHFDYVAGESASGIAQVSYATGIPTIFGIITSKISFLKNPSVQFILFILVKDLFLASVKLSEHEVIFNTLPPIE